MKNVPERLRRVVLKRAAGRCEYCGLAQEGQEATFHIDHVVSKTAKKVLEENRPAPRSLMESQLLDFDHFAAGIAGNDALMGAVNEQV